ncbi:MAG: nucleotidyltransferase [Candidatus Sumerlaeota bacterium]|nr:nucleotidyltransferase [Candidatus Sumerlaeota bacterium]
MIDHVTKVFRSLNSREVRYVTVGGIAAILHGVPRATFDLDILIENSLENARRLLEALEAIGFGTTALVKPEEVASNVGTIFKDFVRVDVLTSIPGVTFDEAWAEKTIMEFQGQQFFVLSRRHVIASKKAAGRPKDIQDVSMLESQEPKAEE